MMSLLVGFSALLFLAALLAASEMAFISVHPVRLRELAHRGDRGAKGVLKLKTDHQHFLGAILIATNFSHIIATTLMSYFLQTYFSIHSEVVVTAIMLPLLLIFCEVFPKEYARLHALSFLIRGEMGLQVLHRLLYWPAHAVIKMTEIFFPSMRKRHEKIFMNEVEFKALVAESEKRGVLDPHERDFVNMILDFERISVRSVMIPLVQVAAVELHSDIQAVRREARDKGDRVVLVYEDDPAIVAGVIYVFDVLSKEREEGPLNDFLKAPLFIPETMPLEEAFQILRKKRQSFALVTDARYEVIGVAPIESLLLGRQG